MSGLGDPHNFPEKSMKFAYEKSFIFTLQRNKENIRKSSSKWHDKFLVYRNDYDLLQVPANIIPC